METIKIIDLLVKIANGEEVPKKIKWHNIMFNHIIDESDESFEDYINDNKCSLFEHVYDDIYKVTNILNDEVKIIEEDKKIEYVGRTYDLTDFYKNYPEVAEMLRDLANKTIEIIDFINEGRDE